MSCKAMLIVFFGYFNAGNYYLRGEPLVNKEREKQQHAAKNLIKVENTQKIPMLL